MKKDDPENSEMEKKDRLEILWEDMQGKFELVFEGHAALRADMRNMKEELLTLIKGLSIDLSAVQTDMVDLRKDVSTIQTKVKENRTEIKKLDKKIDHVADELAAHREDTERHRGYGYKVSES